MCQGTLFAPGPPGKFKFLDGRAYYNLRTLHPILRNLIGTVVTQAHIKIHIIGIIYYNTRKVPITECTHNPTIHVYMTEYTIKGPANINTIKQINTLNNKCTRLGKKEGRVGWRGSPDLTLSHIRQMSPLSGPPFLRVFELSIFYRMAAPSTSNSLTSKGLVQTSKGFKYCYLRH